MARKSLTLVWVGPGVSRSPSFSKNSVELLSARKAAGSRPSWRARAQRRRVDEGAGRVVRLPPPPSVPSVSAASAAIPGAPVERHARAPARIPGWARRGPCRGTVTVSSPPESKTARRPCAWSVAGEPRMLGGDGAGLALELGRRAECSRSRRRAPRPRPLQTRRPAGAQSRTRSRRRPGRRASAFRWRDRRAPGRPRRDTSSR